MKKIMLIQIISEKDLKNKQKSLVDKIKKFWLKFLKIVNIMRKMRSKMKNKVCNEKEKSESLEKMMSVWRRHFEYFEEDIKMGKRGKEERIRGKQTIKIMCRRIARWRK